jgi:raffinose/stachyose/melibiose transport system permease protein
MSDNLSAISSRSAQKDPDIKKSYWDTHAKEGKMLTSILDYIVLIILSIVFLFPIFIVLMDSFKSNLSISSNAFSWPTAESFVGWDNYVNGIERISFWKTFGNSLFITVVSTVLILILSCMTAWYLTRVKTWWSKVIYYLIVFSMIVPFQMIMLPMSGLASWLNLNNVYGIVVLYVGFGAGLSTFVISGFVKGIPTEVEEAAVVDGCNTLQVFFLIVVPLLKPVIMTVAVLNVMWIWNDFLLPYVVLSTRAGETTLPVAIQLANQGAYGNKDYGVFMAMIVLSIIPVIVFYLFGQKYIIKGVMAGAVKG